VRKKLLLSIILGCALGFTSEGEPAPESLGSSDPFEHAPDGCVVLCKSEECPAQRPASTATSAADRAWS
jgi:hypothetical protein